MNITLLIGRLTRDPESQGEGDSKRARFSIAIDRPKDGAGADFINCTAFGRTAENILKYCKKGTMISVEGSLNSYSYENEEGQRISGMSVNARRVQFLSRPSSESTGEESAPQAQTKAEERAEEQSMLQQAFEDFGDIVEADDLPF